MITFLNDEDVVEGQWLKDVLEALTYPGRRVPGATHQLRYVAAADAGPYGEHVLGHIPSGDGPQDGGLVQSDPDCHSSLLVRRLLGKTKRRSGLAARSAYRFRFG